MTTQTISAFDFYNSLPVDVLMRIRSSHIDNLSTMNDILFGKAGQIEETEDGFVLVTEDGDEVFIGETVDEALDFITSEEF